MDETRRTSRLLLIDDDPVVAGILALRIQRSCPGVAVDCQNKPVATPGYDIYVVDNDFGGSQEGVRLAESLAVVSPGATVLVLSSFLDTTLLKRAVNVQCKGAFDKRDPDDVALLLRAIADASSAGPGEDMTATAQPRGLVREVANLINEWNQRMGAEEGRRNGTT